MEKAADPVALSLLPDPFPQEYAAMRVQHAIYLKAVKHSHDDL
jgi:hypothetical protein